MPQPDPGRDDLSGAGAVTDVLGSVGLGDDEVARALLEAVHTKDPMTAAHVLRTTLEVASFAADLSLDDDEAVLAVRAALLHDVGKIEVPDELLMSPGRLVGAEWEVMRGHVANGVRILTAAGVDDAVVAAVGAHHEHWDGGGYPAGLCGEDIPFAARMVSVCDAVDAMRFARRYRTGHMDVAEVVEVLEVGAGTQWDPRLAAAMVDRLHAA